MGNIELELYNYLRDKYPDIRFDFIIRANGVKWYQESQYIDSNLEKDIRNFLGEHLSEFYWTSSYQYVYVK